MKIFEFCNISHMQILPPADYNINTKWRPEIRAEKYHYGIDLVQFKHSNQDRIIYPNPQGIDSILKELDENAICKNQYASQYDPQIIFTCSKDCRYIIEKESYKLFDEFKDFTGKSGDIFIEAFGRKVALNLTLRLTRSDKIISLFTFPKVLPDFTTNNAITRSVYESVFKDREGI